MKCDKKAIVNFLLISCILLTIYSLMNTVEGFELVQVNGVGKSEQVEDASRISYDVQTFLGTKQVERNPEGSELASTSVLSDFTPSSYLALSNTKQPFSALVFTNFNYVDPRMLEEFPTTALLKRPVPALDNLYLRLANNKDGAIGVTVVVVSGANQKVLYNKSFVSEIKADQNEILINFGTVTIDGKEQDGLPTGNNQVVVLLNRDGKSQIDVSEMLFNFRGDFASLQKNRILKERLPISGVSDVDAERIQKRLKDILEKQMNACPKQGGYKFINFGTSPEAISNSKCVTYCNRDADCTNALLETAIDSNVYAKADDAFCQKRGTIASFASKDSRRKFQGYCERKILK